MRSRLILIGVLTLPIAGFAYGQASQPTILSRAQWGANEELLFARAQMTHEQPQSTEESEHAHDVSVRTTDCLEAQKNFPQEFKKERVVTHAANGRRYRWAQEYSEDVKLLVVHHTALKVAGDKRSPLERMRALYEFHTDKRGWGDIGYHYIIDEKGTIYEGRAGGDKVVGGHVYCANTGTIGIGLMGNFEVEKPTQRQMRSTKWLLRHLADTYNINVNQEISFHGERMKPIVVHGDLAPTACAGHYVNETLAQVVTHVASNNIDANIIFPSIARTRTRRTLSFVGTANTSGFAPVSSTTLHGRPGSQDTFLLRYTTDSNGENRRGRLGIVRRSENTIGLWQELDGRDMRVRREILAPKDLGPNQTATIRMRVQFPSQSGEYTVALGDVTYHLHVDGRRVRNAHPLAHRHVHGHAHAHAHSSTAPRRESVVPTSFSVSRARTRPLPQTIVQTGSDGIRIRLSYDQPSAQITASSVLTINDQRTRSSSISLSKRGNNCVATQGTSRIAEGSVRISNAQPLTIASWERSSNQFRGTIECRVIDNTLVLINELPLEDYLAGLAEEPDTEPWEKQRAFAIAARSYAAFYMEPEHEKFPGMPYDGDDSPARFQSYGGLVFESYNPRWVQAVRDTTGTVVMKDGDIIKTAYFSSNDGRTRSPEENGWNGYPHSEVFQSKSDPWCNGMSMRGHGVGMSGCGAEGQANEGKTAEEILSYYYEGTTLHTLRF